MLIAEDLALLLHDDESGKGVVDRHTVELALAGAVLVELAGRGRVRIAAGGEDAKEGRVVADGDGPVGDELLDDGLAEIRDGRERKPPAVLDALRTGLRERVLERLVAAGELERDDRRALGLVSYTRWPAGSGHREDDVRRELDAALLHGAAPSERTAALVGLLSAIDAVPRVVEAEDRKALERRAEELSEGPWATAAVRDAVRDVQAAVMTAVLAATTAATVTSN